MKIDRRHRHAARRPQWRASLLAACAGLALVDIARAQTTPAAPAASAPSASAPAASLPPAPAPAAPAPRPAAPPTPTTVIVTGQRAALRDAMQAQQDADNIVSIVRSDGIGKLPDTNAAEALQRIPGISLQRDQGEGRYITVRGLNADLNATTINGATVPSPEAGTRGVALDVLPAGLIRSLEVSKTLTPDRDANSLGGTVEIKTLSAFDLPGSFLSVDGGVSHNGNTNQVSPKFGALAAGRFMDGKLGLAVGASTETRKFGSDNVETGGAWSEGRLESFELRDYRPVRKRHALAFNLDYRPQTGSAWYLRALASQYSDEEIRNRMTIGDFDNDDESLTEGETATGEVERRLRGRKFIQSIRSLLLGTEQTLGDWKLDASLGASAAREKTPEGVADARFAGTDAFEGLGFSNSRKPRLIGPESLFDAANYELDEILLSARDARDREQHVKFDVSRGLDIGDLEVDFKFGAKASRRKASSDEEIWSYDSDEPDSGNYWGPGGVSLVDFASGNVDYGLGRFGPGIDKRKVLDRVAGLSRAGARLDVDSTISDFSMREDINAAYLMASTEVNALYLMAGVRYEGTRFSAKGTRVNEEEETFEPVSRKRKYSDTLPTVQARYKLDKDTAVRAAWTNAVVRPNFEQLSPGVVIASSTEAEFGNPDLKPLTSSNFDLGIERALGRDAAVSAYVFTKDIKNFVYATNVAGTGEWVDFEEALTFVNGDKARVRGLELSYQQSLRMLPEPFNGLIVGANATFTQSKAKIGQFDIDEGQVLTRNIRLPGQSNRVFNLSLGYEAGRISTRLAANSKSPYLLEVGDPLDAANDAIVDTQTQLDFSFQFKLSETLQLTFEAQNINNAKYYVYQGSRAYNYQFEQYGRTYKLGLRALLF